MVSGVEKDRNRGGGCDGNWYEEGGGKWWRCKR